MIAGAQQMHRIAQGGLFLAPPRQPRAKYASAAPERNATS